MEKQFKIIARFGETQVESFLPAETRGEAIKLAQAIFEGGEVLSVTEVK